MRTRWEGFHRGLVASVATLGTDQQFELARREVPELEPFVDVASLRAFVERGVANGEDKDAIYRALIRAVQARAFWAPLASAVLWCGLWPGLQAVYRRKCRHFTPDLEELASLISVAFTTLVANMDLQAVNQVAATLVRSTEREVERAWRRQQQISFASQPPPLTPPELTLLDGGVDGPEPYAAEPEPPSATPSVLGIPAGLSEAGQVALLYRWLHGAIGDDAALFLEVAVFEEDPERVAAKLGLPAAALRKRLQRIRTRLGRWLSQNLAQSGL
jgi:DNA-directed RNA polymerase specialized sigma24 family protein